MAKQKSHDATAKSKDAVEASVKNIFDDAEKWGFEFANDMEREYVKNACELPLHANQGDWRKCMLASVLAVLLENGLSEHEFVDVLSRTRFFRPSLLEPSVGEALRKADAEIALCDAAIRVELEKLATGIYQNDKGGTDFNSDAASLFLKTSLGSLELFRTQYEYGEPGTTIESMHPEVDVGLAAIALQEGWAISWFPELDQRLRAQATVWRFPVGVAGSRLAIRLDDHFGEHLGVVVVCARGALHSRGAQTEMKLLHELEHRCAALRTLLQRRRPAIAEKRLYAEVRAREFRDESNVETSGRNHASVDQIGQLFDELAALNLQRAEKADGSGVPQRIAECLDRLRHLQEKEAAAIESHFSRTLSLPIGVSEILLQDAHQIAERYANTSREHKTSDDSDSEAT